MSRCSLARSFLPPSSTRVRRPSSARSASMVRCRSSTTISFSPSRRRSTSSSTRARSCRCRPPIITPSPDRTEPLLLPPKEPPRPRRLVPLLLLPFRPMEPRPPAPACAHPRLPRLLPQLRLDGTAPVQRTAPASTPVNWNHSGARPPLTAPAPAAATTPASAPADGTTPAPSPVPPAVLPRPRRC